MTVSPDDVKAAARAIAGSVIETPTVHSPKLSDLLGAHIDLKLENLHYTASFKERGALNCLLGLDQARRAAGVIAMSAGNHAQAVAHHARRLGIAATIVMPGNTPFQKIANTEALGATVMLEGDDLAESAAAAAREVEARGLVLVHPYEDSRVIAGQGTVALEMLRAAPDLDMLAVPVGGGGLIAGSIVAARAIRPDIEIVGVQAARCPAMLAALGGTDPEIRTDTLAEGIAVKRPGRMSRAIIAGADIDILLVEEGEIESAIMLLAEAEKLVVEGAGAAALAAILAHPRRFAGRRVGVVVSGGNPGPAGQPGGAHPRGRSPGRRHRRGRAPALVPRRAGAQDAGRPAGRGSQPGRSGQAGRRADGGGLCRQPPGLYVRDALTASSPASAL